MPAIIGAPHSVALDITNKCNLRCLHCFNNSGENDVVANELSDNEVLELVDSICQMHPFSFCFCGGETLLRKDLVIESLRRLSASGVKCNLVSNGLLANSNTLHELERAGLNGIQFSLDGLRDSHEHMRGLSGLYDRVLDAIDITAERNLTAPFNCLLSDIVQCRRFQTSLHDASRQAEIVG